MCMTRRENNKQKLLKDHSNIEQMNKYSTGDGNHKLRHGLRSISNLPCSEQIVDTLQTQSFISYRVRFTNVFEIRIHGVFSLLIQSIERLHYLTEHQPVLFIRGVPVHVRDENGGLQLVAGQRPFPASPQLRLHKRLTSGGELIAMYEIATIAPEGLHHVAAQGSVEQLEGPEKQLLSLVRVVPAVLEASLTALQEALKFRALDHFIRRVDLQGVVGADCEEVLERIALFLHHTPDGVHQFFWAEDYEEASSLYWGPLVARFAVRVVVLTTHDGLIIAISVATFRNFHGNEMGGGGITHKVCKPYCSWKF